MPKFKGPKASGFVMNMGFNSKDSDTTFKEKDQANINSGPGGKLVDAMKKNNAQYGSIKTKGNKTTILTIADNRKSAGPGINDLPKKSAPKTPSSPKPYVKKGGKATGSIKNYAIGSDARRKEYDARGWAYDNTIKKPKAVKSVASTINKSKPASVVPSPKASVLTSAPKASTSAPKTKSSKIRAKGEAALASGNVKKAQRLRKRYDRVAKKETKKSKPSSSSTRTYTSTLKLPSGSSAFDARGSYSKLAAQNATNAYSQGNFSLSNTNMTYNKKKNEVSLASAYKVKFK
jgi:hypothetical protein